MRKTLYAIWLGLLLAPALAEETDREARFLSFSVRDRHGIFLRDLRQEEVTVLVDGQPIDVRFFGYQNTRTAVAMVLENSPRTAPFRKSLPQFGRINTLDQIRYRLIDNFLPELLPRTNILVGQFYKELEVLRDFTDDEYALRDALHGMEPRFDSLDTQNIPVAKMLGQSVELLRERPEMRKILIFFTTTVDTESIKYLDEYRDLLRESDVDVYIISFASRQAVGAGYSHAERINQFYFKRLASETSGQLYLAGEYVFIDEFMDDLLNRIAHSYTIGFYIQPGRPAQQHSVELRLKRAKCDIRHRSTISY